MANSAFPPLGFATRLGLATSALIVVVCAAQSWIGGRRDLERMRRYLGDRGKVVSEALAREAGPSVVAGKVEALHRLAEQARAQSDVASCRFFDGHGLLLMSLGKPGTGVAPLRAPAGRETVGPIAVGDDVWEFQAPIFGRDGGTDRVGTVTVDISLDSLEALRRETFATATVLALLCTLGAVFAAVLIARAITRPLQALATAADAIAQGDLEARVRIRTSDEVGSVARAFNGMAESLARSRAALEEHSRALEDKVLQLERANRLKSEFLTTVSHELRTPLNVIMGYTDMLVDGGLGTVNEEQAAVLVAIRDYTRRELELITDVLDFARLTSGRVSFHVERFALGALLDEVRSLHASRTGDVQLVTRVAPGLPPLETDRVKLLEILRNLVDNALKFTTKGEVTLAATFGDAAGWVTVEVTDTGPGIPADELAHIFEPFHQVGESTTRSTGGVGLGLSIVKQLAEALGGTVVVTSAVGGGSTFRLAVPCRLAANEGILAAALDDVERNAAALPDRARKVRLRAARSRTARDVGT